MLILRELREEAGLTQKELAEKLNSTQRNISNWEKGTSQPDIQTLIALADFFCVSLDELTGRERDHFVKSDDASFLYTIRSLTKTQQKAIMNLIESLRTGV